MFRNPGCCYNLIDNRCNRITDGRHQSDGVVLPHESRRWVILTEEPGVAEALAAACEQGPGVILGVGPGRARGPGI